jgi:hypothetical protein
MELIRFQLWTGKSVSETYGGKAVLDSNGEPLFAELAILRLLEKDGYKGVWVDTYRKCFRDAMPPAVCELPVPAREVYDRIVAANGGTSGCWDVIAWKDGEYLFIESKRKGKDRMRKSQLCWRDAAIRAGLKPDSFHICEWDIEASEARKS